MTIKYQKVRKVCFDGDSYHRLKTCKCGARFADMDLMVSEGFKGRPRYAVSCNACWSYPFAEYTICQAIDAFNKQFGILDECSAVECELDYSL